MSEKLCPFCGNVDLFADNVSLDVFMVGCACGAHSLTFRREEGGLRAAVAWWNRRSLPAAIETVREALESGGERAVEVVWPFAGPNARRDRVAKFAKLLDTLSASQSPDSPVSAPTEPGSGDGGSAGDTAACGCPDNCRHDSDCAVHGPPALPAGACDCTPQSRYEAERDRARATAREVHARKGAVPASGRRTW